MKFRIFYGLFCIIKSGSLSNFDLTQRVWFRLFGGVYFISWVLKFLALTFQRSCCGRNCEIVGVLFESCSQRQVEFVSVWNSAKAEDLSSAFTTLATLWPYFTFRNLGICQNVLKPQPSWDWSHHEINVGKLMLLSEFLSAEYWDSLLTRLEILMSVFVCESIWICFVLWFWFLFILKLFVPSH